MKKKFLALSVAALVGGFAIGASAAVIPGTGAVYPAAAGAGLMHKTDATTLALNPGGTGHILLVPYYTVQNGNATLLNLVNTDTVNGKAVKVRFRGAQNSDDVFDFQVYLSPGDVWTGAISQGADGRAAMSSADNTCTLPKIINQGFVTDRLPGDAAAKAAGTREGYVEIFNMADIPPVGAPGDATLYGQIKHKSDGTVGCGSPLTTLSVDVLNEADAVAKGFDTPSGGLMANWTVINVPAASSWSGNATAISAIDAGAVIRHGTFVWFPQTPSAPTPALNLVTADPILRIKPGMAANYDLPDLSTPYTVAVAPIAGDPELQASRLTAAIATRSVTNEYLTDPGLAASTDWVFSMPTRRYAVAVDYSAAAASKLVFNQGVVVPTGTYAADSYFAAAAGAGVQVAGGANTAGSGANVRLQDETACVKIGKPAIWNRSEGGLTSDEFVISPGVVKEVELCGETNVLSFNDSGVSVLGAAIARSNIDIGSFIDGWAGIPSPGNPSVVNALSSVTGLPVVGQAFVQAVNAGVAAGTSGNFGVSWDHRTVRP